MSGPGPVPSAGNVIPPPLFNFPWVRLRDGLLTIQAISQMTQFWALVVGEDGIAQNVAILFDMSGDATITALGVITVTKTNGVAFGYFAPGTDAAQLTGTLAAARIAAGSLPYAKLVNAAGAIVLGAGGAGAIVAITMGRNMEIVAGALVEQDPIETVGTLGAPTAGLRAFVSDSNVAAAGNFGAIVATGGANFVPVYADGANWLIG